ncbi:MAG: hypothetical protein GF346_03335 [Candidatus Eisenbacteria bacterium]|nr:hypothetical protein [Candidatus Latescibacterota bacterium]MBD3301455.1 hypothetical protein [Candidatus Eisenbacteria bacterium]
MPRGGGMKLFVSADIEGIGGVATWTQARVGGPEHKRARQWMTEEVNIAIEGALEGGLSEALVCDAHGDATNILWEELHPKARLVTGWGPELDMLLGIDDGFATVFLIGHHPGASARRGLLSHCFTRRILDCRFNGLPCNEGVIAAIQAGIHGIPIGLVSGQVELEEELRPTLPDFRFVPTKQGLFWQSAILDPRAAVHRRMRAAAREAAEAIASGAGPEPFRPEPPLRLEMELSSVEAAAAVEGLEGVDRTGSARCLLAADDARAFIRRFFKLLNILYAAKDTP